MAYRKGSCAPADSCNIKVLIILFLISGVMTASLNREGGHAFCGTHLRVAFMLLCTGGYLDQGLEIAQFENVTQHQLSAVHQACCRETCSPETLRSYCPTPV